jgi:hypothetical protein
MPAEDGTADLFAELAADQVATGGTCTTRKVLEAMDPAERDEWEQAIANPAYTTASLYRVAQRRGIPFSAQGIQRHARRIRYGNGGCLCPRP